tara:strand:+ start:48 stop:233 length:186 start_codon:yes stop_codon:yes gene_type:complete
MLKEKILKRLTFLYGIKGEEVKKGSICIGYYKNVPVEDEKFNKFYYTLNEEQKKLFLQLYE